MCLRIERRHLGRRAAALRRFVGIHRGNVSSEKWEPLVGHGLALARHVASLQLFER